MENHDIIASCILGVLMAMIISLAVAFLIESIKEEKELRAEQGKKPIRP
ncbi:MAG: hypothetical protein WDN75_02000 [Bacteroidota bacterium]